MRWSECKVLQEGRLAFPLLPFAAFAKSVASVQMNTHPATLHSIHNTQAQGAVAAAAPPLRRGSWPAAGGSCFSSSLYLRPSLLLPPWPDPTPHPTRTSHMQHRQHHQRLHTKPWGPGGSPSFSRPPFASPLSLPPPPLPPLQAMASSAPAPAPIASLDNVLHELQHFQQQLEQERAAVAEERQRKDAQLQVRLYAGRGEGREV